EISNLVQNILLNAEELIHGSHQWANVKNIKEAEKILKKSINELKSMAEENLKTAKYLNSTEKIKLSDFSRITNLIRERSMQNTPNSLFRGETYDHSKYAAEKLDKIFYAKGYGDCVGCGKPLGPGWWCNHCNTEIFRKNFSSWTSGDIDIDGFIQESQLAARNCLEILEWIPFDKIKGFKEFECGGFNKVYKGVWTDGSIIRWDRDIEDWIRHKIDLKNSKLLEDCQPNEKIDGIVVALKSLFSPTNTGKDLSEWKIHLECHRNAIRDFKAYLIPLYGITRRPETGEYMIVMRYAERGTLRSDIQNNIFHGDLHSDNILQLLDSISVINDLGECKSIYDSPNDDLRMAILNGMKPEVDKLEDVPQPYIDLMERCWDLDLNKRPTAIELRGSIIYWSTLCFIDPGRTPTLQSSIRQKLDNIIESVFESYEDFEDFDDPIGDMENFFRIIKYNNLCLDEEVHDYLADAEKFFQINKNSINPDIFMNDEEITDTRTDFFNCLSDGDKRMIRTSRKVIPQIYQTDNFNEEQSNSFSGHYSQYGEHSMFYVL
ncbi:2202_t:CDS:2, partial [Acaulospora colombiana]